MFDSVLNERKVARQRAVGSFISAAAHVLIIGGIIWYSTKPKGDAKPKAVPVAFLNTPKAAAPAAAPPPPPPPPKKKKKTTPIVKKDIVIPKEIPKEKPPEKPPDPTPDDSSDDDDTDDGVEGGVEGGVKGGVVGGVVGGQLGGQLGGGGDQPVFFGDGMTKPTMDAEASESFHWTTAQLDARVEGLCLVQCVITKDGALKDCKILKRIPQVEDAQIMDYLAHVKYHPAMQGDKPISLKGFTIPLRLKVP
ncbi:MAG: energy transducer TonB [Deltaproteobacteria bacterium]|nr:energy transducer TonB [Deltaproteobacteria bacterium]